MEFDVSNIVNSALAFEIDSMQFSASVSEMGQDAGEVTWRNCIEIADSLEGVDRIAVLPSELEAIREHFREYGAWDEEEVLAWSDVELNALLIQEVMSEVRDIERYETLDEWNTACEDGQCSGRLSGNGETWYLYAGN